MREATGPLPAVSGLGQVIAVSERVIAELRATQELLRRDLAVRGPLDDLAQAEFRLAEMEAAYRRGIEGAMFRAVDPVLSVPYLAAVPDAPVARHRHRQRRVPRPRIPGEHPIMRLVPKVLIPAAAGAWGALKLAASHGRAHVALTAHTARIAAMTTGGTGVAAVLTVAAVHTMSPVAAHPGRYAGPSPSAPAASAWSASRMSSSPPAAPVAHGGVDANRAGPAGIVPLAPWSPPPSSAPPAVAPTPTPSAGQLALSSVTADLSSGQQVTITLYALGGDVTWHAWCGGQDVTLSAGSGTAAPGVPSLLVFSAAPAQDGAVVARCHVWPGGYSVSVLLPIPPSPSPSASPSPAPAITDTPTPDPSSS